MRRKFDHGRYVVGKVRVGDGGRGQKFDLVRGRGREQIVQFSQNIRRRGRRQLRGQVLKCPAGAHEPTLTGSTGTQISTPPEPVAGLNDSV